MWRQISITSGARVLTRRSPGNLASRQGAKVSPKGTMRQKYCKKWLSTFRLLNGKDHPLLKKEQT